MSNTTIISLLGKPGSGKGTQTDLLCAKTGFTPINTGRMLRERAKQNDALGNVVKESLHKGLLVPTPVVFLMWMPKLVDLKDSNGPGVVFDGNPRKKYEAQMIDEVLEAFQWNMRSIHIMLSDEEARKRMEGRQRTDDNGSVMDNRLAWFQTDVVPVIEYYRSKGVLSEVDGEGTVEEVHERIMNELSL